MDKQVKDSIITAGKEFMDQHGLKQAPFARLCGLNPSYVSNMMNGNYNYKAGEGKEVEIGDRHFVIMANAIGFSLEKKYWDVVETDQFVEIVHALERTREMRRLHLIVGETGCGKTYAVEAFCKANPQHVYRVTLSNISSIYDVIDDLTEKVGLSTTVRRQGKVARMVARVIDLYQQGVRPTIIMDEGENVKLPIVGLWKTLYDLLVKPGYCGLAVLGTPEMLRILESFCRREKVGAKQFMRRAKAGIVRLALIDRTYKAFFEGKQIDPHVKTLLLGMCDNYGELHDYWEPAMRAADEDGVPLTEAYFREFYGITQKLIS